MFFLREIIYINVVESSSVYEYNSKTCIYIPTKHYIGMNTNMYTKYIYNVSLSRKLEHRNYMHKAR